MRLDSPAVTRNSGQTGYEDVMPMTMTSRVRWSVVGVVIATGLIVTGALSSAPWMLVPAAILLAYTGGPLVTWGREERRIRAEVSRGMSRIESWLRTAPAVSAASVGATCECCPVCGAPVDPRSARCRRHGTMR